MLVTLTTDEQNKIFTEAIVALVDDDTNAVFEKYCDVDEAWPYALTEFHLAGFEVWPGGNVTVIAADKAEAVNEFRVLCFKSLRSQLA